jgi:hypothetical protein
MSTLKGLYGQFAPQAAGRRSPQFDCRLEVKLSSPVLQGRHQSEQLFAARLVRLLS